MQGSVSESPASSRAFHGRSFTPTHKEKMANEQHSLSPRPWLLDAVPFMVVLLIAAHVLALVHSQKTTSFSYSFTSLSLSPILTRSLIFFLFTLFQVYWIYRLATEKQPQRRKAHWKLTLQSLISFSKMGKGFS